MADFPRTTVDGVSLSRMIVGTNWFLGYSHHSGAKDKFIREFQTVERVADTMTVFFESGVDTVMGMPTPMLSEAIKTAEDRTGREGALILTPGFGMAENGPDFDSAAEAFDQAKELGAKFCFPHTSATDQLLDPLRGEIRGYPKLAEMIRDRDMIPGLSTHLPQSVIIADNQDYDVASYIQIYNAAGFLMPVEVDWVMRVIRNAKKPVMTIKSMAAGKLLPPVGLAFSWATLRDQDMVTVGTTTADEARELLELSFDFLSHRMPDNQLQKTRSKKSLEAAN
ncbi:MAG: hypothetical protein QGH33_07715 [Pirellulaceae bacterium]|nr:hypothetical protein [Pirellulaceae bacterium]